MQKKIIAVFMAVLLAVSCLSVNVFAIEFDGTSKTNQELWSAWLKEFKDFTSDPANKADDMIKANLALTVGLAKNGQTAIGNTSADIGSFIGSMTEEICTTGRISDDTLTKFRNIFTEEGFQCDNEAFNQWYNDKFGKDYYKHNLTPYPTSSQYYLFYECYEGDEKFRVFIESYDGTPLTVKEDENGKYFEGIELGKVVYKVYKKNIKNKKTGEWSEWFAIKDDWSTGYVSQYKCYLDEIFVRNGCPMHIRTNLPLNYWGDIIGGDPVTDWSELGDDFVDTVEGGDGLTADELGDLTDDLLQALLDNMPDLTTTNGILQAIYRKCCEISNKIGKQATNVYKQTLQGIQTSLDKINAFCSEFWGKFTDIMQSLFVPADDYLLDSLEDIQDEFSLKFVFADSLKKILTKCFDVYKAGGTKAPTVTFHITGLGFLNSIISHTIDLSDWDEYVKPIRSIVCVITYATFAWNTYRRIPAYVSGVGEQ